ncbi:MAG: AAA family ATPase, partial [Flavobacteriaceae bacterium]
MVVPASLKINKLILLGFRKDYIIPFHPGVNIIYGDADTGKSSILRIVYYLLGSKLPELDVEIASSANRAVLEIEIDGAIYCIHRDLFDGNVDVEVFSCPFEEMNENFPTKFGATFAPKGREKKSLSEHLLDLLNFPNIDIKVAPSKDDSRLARLSIRDLFKFCYLNQDVVGSRQILDLNNPTVFVKNKEVFKYIFNALDGNISALQTQIAEKTQQHHALENKLRVVTEFLEDTQFQSSSRIKEELAKIYGREESLNELLKEVNSRITNDSESYDELKDILDSINLRVRSLEGDKAA